MNAHNEPRGVYRCLEPECEFVAFGPDAPRDCPLCGGCVERLPAGLVNAALVMRARMRPWERREAQA